jgi:uncharacterized repeat protein (TIGR01451 family)
MAALGVGLAILVGSASAAPTWSPPRTLFEDDNVDFLIKGEGNTQDGIIEQGDLLVSVFEFLESAGEPIGPEELTGLAIIEVAEIVDLGGGIAFNIFFKPPTLGFDFYSGIAPLPDGTGAAGNGAMIAFWLDGTPELIISADNITAGTASCSTLAGCTDQATDGDIWLIAGISDDPDSFWVAPNAQLDTTVVDGANPGQDFGFFNAGLSILLNRTEQLLAINEFACAPFCAPGGDGKVDIGGSGDIKGGGENRFQSEWFATGDLDMTLLNESLDPNIDIEKLTNGNDADDANGFDVPLIAPGDTVTWTYVVTNTGNVPFDAAEVEVTDDQFAATGVTPLFDISSDDGSDGILSPGEQWLYTATMPAENLASSSSGVTIVDGCDPASSGNGRETYENIGTVVAGSETDEDPSHYCNPPEPGIDIEKLTNGNQADGANDNDVPQIAPGDTVTWTYQVTNTGEVPFALEDVDVSDDQPGVDPVFDPTSDDGDNILSPGEQWLYTATLPAENLIESTSGATIVDGCDPGDTGLTRRTYENTGTVVAGENTDFDPSHYCNPPDPGIAIEKLTNGNDADGANDVDVPVIAPGNVVVWTYRVTNTGNVSFALEDVTVTDDQPGVSPVFDAASDDGDSILSPGEVWLYTATLPAEDLMNSVSGATIVDGCDPGNTGITRDTYENIGTVIAGEATDMDPSHYCNPVPGIDIEKLTNGNDADGANDNDVPQIAPGDTVTWTYIVTNTGEVTFTSGEVVVTDDQFPFTGVSPVFDPDSDDGGDGLLSPGEQWLYTASQPAETLATSVSGVTIVAGCDADNTGNTRETYENLGTVVAGSLTDSDPSHYCNPPPQELGCRVTGGLNDVFATAVGDNRYTAGGQAGANTAQQPQPKGEWTHNQQSGPAGDFTFHGGTSSAPEGTEIDVIRCSDPGGCAPSGNPPSPLKQIDFDGIGTFRNIGKQGDKIPDFVLNGANVTAEGNGNENFDGTLHWFEVNIDDLGEPGNTNPMKNPGDADTNLCPLIGFGEKGATPLAECSCSDFYRITIYDGVNAADVVKNPDGSIDPSQMNRTDVIYQVWGYIDGGNLQLHHPTGFDRK